MITLFLENSIGVSTRGGIHSVNESMVGDFPMKTDGVGVRGGVGGGEGGNAARSNAGIGQSSPLITTLGGVGGRLSMVLKTFIGVLFSIFRPGGSAKHLKNLALK